MNDESCLSLGVPDDPIVDEGVTGRAAAAFVRKAEMSKHGSTCLTDACDIRGGCSGYRSGNILCKEGYKSRD
jgi:hypothetical protein